MARVPQADAHALRDPRPVLEGRCAKLREAGLRILDRVDGLDLPVDAAARVARIQQLDFAFLDARRIWQHDRAQVLRRARREYRTVETKLRQLRNEAAVVDVRVGQDERVDLVRIEREGAIVQLLLGLRALHHPAIDKNARGSRVDEEARSGHAFAGAVEREFHECWSREDAARLNAAV